MLKIALVLFVLFLLCTAASSASMPVLTHTNGVCSDSDGFDPFTRGNVSLFFGDRGDFYLDSCIDGITVREWSCAGQDNVAEDQYSCPFGFVCRDGACESVNVPVFIASEPETCLDSDGLDENTSGYVAIYRSGTELYTLNDTCIGWFNVSEAYCAQDHGASAGKYTIIGCANGSYCMDGACVNCIEIKPVQVFNVSPMPPVVQVSRIIPYVASAGSDLPVKLVVDADLSRVGHRRCA